MQKTCLVATVSAFLIAAMGVSGCSGEHHAHWSYEGKTGPAHWGKLDEAYAMCKHGMNQSPINILDAIKAELPPLNIHYQPGSTAILNNGHTIQVDYKKGNVLKMDGHEFVLKQFHFHSPSENQIKGVSYPLEAHLVHADAKGNLAVVAIMFETGKKNDVIEALWKKMPKHEDDRHSLERSKIHVGDLLPPNLDYYRYNGSLTTPPCSEGVRWFVLKTPVPVSEEQVKTFEQVMHHHNNRPTQPLNARKVLQ
ncbi:MAG: carbonic anhydrase family protein [Gammaproteobacteria bacterium]|nr:MAG: carbonic anhydrase family protein [Gammaproteobacteria bacterium]